MSKNERTEVIVVRVSPRDKEAFEKEAEKLDMSLSEFMRAATLMYLVFAVKPYGLKMFVKGSVDWACEAMQKLREPGLRKIVFGSRRGQGD